MLVAPLARSEAVGVEESPVEVEESPVEVEESPMAVELEESPMAVEGRLVSKLDIYN
jgi:hypothetical protein